MSHATQVTPLRGIFILRQSAWHSVSLPTKFGVRNFIRSKFIYGSQILNLGHVLRSLYGGILLCDGLYLMCLLWVLNLKCLPLNRSKYIDGSKISIWEWWPCVPFDFLTFESKINRFRQSVEAYYYAKLQVITISFHHPKTDSPTRTAWLHDKLIAISVPRTTSCFIKTTRYLDVIAHNFGKYSIRTQQWLCKELIIKDPITH